MSESQASILEKKLECASFKSQILKGKNRQGQCHNAKVKISIHNKDLAYIFIQKNPSSLNKNKGLEEYLNQRC